MAKSKDQYSDKEAKLRLEAALRGARVAESMPMKSIGRKKVDTKKLAKQSAAKQGD